MIHRSVTDLLCSPGMRVRAWTVVWWSYVVLPDAIYLREKLSAVAGGCKGDEVAFGDGRIGVDASLLAACKGALEVLGWGMPVPHVLSYARERLVASMNQFSGGDLCLGVYRAVGMRDLHCQWGKVLSSGSDGAYLGVASGKRRVVEPPGLRQAGERICEGVQGHHTRVRGVGDARSVLTWLCRAHSPVWVKVGRTWSKVRLQCEEAGLVEFHKWEEGDLMIGRAASTISAGAPA